MALEWIAGEQDNLVAQRGGSTFTIEPARREGPGSVFLLVEGVAADATATTGMLLPSADDAKRRAEELLGEIESQ